MKTILTLMLTAALAATLLALSGCGGGDEEEPDVPTPGVDCQVNPKACV